MTTGVVIIGGGVMGSAVAYFLRQVGFREKVLVVERDLTYRHASTALSVGGIRQQYGTAVNARLSRESLEFYEHFSDRLEVWGERPDIRLQQRGYLFLVDAAHWPVMQRWHLLQSVGRRTPACDAGPTAGLRVQAGNTGVLRSPACHRSEQGLL